MRFALYQTNHAVDVTVTGLSASNIDWVDQVTLEEVL